MFDWFKHDQGRYNLLYKWVQAKLWQPWGNMGFDEMGTHIFDMNIKTKIKNNVTFTYPKEGAKDKRISGTTKKGFMPDGSRAFAKGNTEDEIIEKIAKQYMQRKKASKVYLCDLLDETLEWKQARKANDENTIKQNRQSYENYIRGSKLEAMPIDEIEFPDIEDFVTSEMIPRYEAKTGHKITSHLRRNNLAILKAILEYAVRKKIIKHNPYKDGTLILGKLEAKPRRKKPEEQTYTDEDMKAIMQKCLNTYLNGKGHHHNTANLAVILDVYLGVRAGELSALKWSDCTLTTEQPYIDIQRAENNHGVIGEVKCDADAGRRRLPLPPEAVELLKMIRSNSKVLSEWIFTQPDGTRRKKKQMQNAIYRAKKQIGLGTAKGLHVIRKTYGSKLADNGCPVTMAKTLLGHERLETTQNYYLHDISSFKEQSEAVSKTFVFNNSLSTSVNEQINQNKAI